MLSIESTSFESRSFESIRLRTRAIFSLILITLVTGGTLQAAEPIRAMREAQRLFQRGVRAERKGDREQARTFFVQAANTAPGLPEPHFHLGNLAFLDGRYDSALGYYSQAELAYVELGNKLYDLELQRYSDAQQTELELRDAIHAIESGKVKFPGADFRVVEYKSQISQLRRIQLPSLREGAAAPAELFFRKGNAQFHVGHLEQAIASWERAVELTPDYPIAHNNLALGYLKQGQAARAQQSLLRAETLGVAVHPGLKRDIQVALAHQR
jgi:tetratricopeptide (TPR) repeat protein